MKRLRRFLRADRGSAAASMAFTIIALVIAGATVSVSITMSMLSSTVTRAGWMTAAVDLRYDQYVREYRATGSPTTAQVCYATENTCVTVSNAATSGSTITLTLNAVYAGTRSTNYTRTLSNNNGQMITGFDSANNPVWGS